MVILLPMSPSLSVYFCMCVCGVCGCFDVSVCMCACACVCGQGEELRFVNTVACVSCFSMLLCENNVSIRRKW